VGGDRCCPVWECACELWDQQSLHVLLVPLPSQISITDLCAPLSSFPWSSHPSVTSDLEDFLPF
jgi:hypothetical protein